MGSGTQRTFTLTLDDDSALKLQKLVKNTKIAGHVHIKRAVQDYLERFYPNAPIHRPITVESEHPYFERGNRQTNPRSDIEV